ncbi:PKD repeat protein [Mucilaginibacter sp. UYNi724]
MGVIFTKRLFLVLISLFAIATASAQTITVGAIDPGPYGGGSSIGVPINVNNGGGCFFTNNVYRLYLSDASGSFASQIQIGFTNGFYATFVNGIIPGGTPAGTGYKVRVISTSPVGIVGTSSAFTINGSAGVLAGIASQSISSGNPDVFGSCSGSGSSPYTFSSTSTSGATATASFFNEITQATEGTPRTVPGSFPANAANYTITVTAAKGGVIGTKCYTLINNEIYRSIGNADNATPCANGSPAVFPLVIDDGQGNGFKYNYPGLTYKVTWGDGTSTTYRYCDIIANGNAISHVFTKASCGNNVGTLKNVFRVELAPFNDYCGSTSVLPGVAYIRVVTPANTDFTHPIAACLGSQVTFNPNISDPGQDPNNNTSDCKNLDALYTWFINGVQIIANQPLTKTFKYTFNAVGTYKVKLKLQNGVGGCGVLEKEYDICIQEAPEPKYTVPVNSGCLPLSLTPNNTSIVRADCNATNSFKWTVTGPAPVKYNSGTNATSVTPQFLFDQPGVYTVKLEVKTESCGTVSAPNIETIVVDGPPVAQLSANKNICGINQTYTFNGDPGPTQSIVSGSSQPGPGDYTWTVTGGAFQFTGGTSASSRYPQILFKDAAAYTISVSSKSACGSPATDSQVLTFQSAPVIDAGTSPPVCIGNPVALQGIITNGTVNSVQWSGGAGAFSNRNSLTSTYTPTAAEYAAGTVTLTLTGYTSLSAPCNEIPDNITISFQPDNSITSTNKFYTCSGAALGYNITSLLAASTFNWTVDAANTSTTISGYAASGSGNVINDVLVNSDINNSAVVTYNITATNGSCTTNIFVLTVSVGPKTLVANFTHDLPGSAGCGNTLVQFTDASAPMSGSTFKWEFEKNGTITSSILANPSNLFRPNNDGSDAVYNVKLTITSPCGIATSSIQTITIRPLLPVAHIIPPTVTACTPVTLSMKNDSPGTNIDYTYYFYKYNNADKTDSTLVFNPVITTSKGPVNIGPISDPGNYTLFMRIRGYCNSIGETVHIPIKIDAASFDSQIFATGPLEGCQGAFAAQIFNNSTPGNTYTYFITNSNGNFNDTKSAGLGAFSYTFPAPGIYYVTLSTQNTCDNKISNVLQFIVHNNPRPDFTSDFTSACRELVVTFTNKTLDDPTTQASSMSYIWDFGDGRPPFSGFSPPPHKYAARNTPYTVTLTATIPATSCTAQKIHMDYINITEPPGTNFEVKPGLITNLPNYHFEFIDRTIGSPKTFVWNFGDGGGSQSQNASHTYADTGKYVVTLKATDINGCDSTFSQQVQITGIPGSLYLPNAFQPSGPTVDLQKFTAKGSGVAKWQLQIFNNWGQLIWQTTALGANGDPTEGWDGTFKGAPLQQGVYIWQASATFINGTEWKGMSYNGSLPKRSGYIHLLR